MPGGSFESADSDSGGPEWGLIFGISNKIHLMPLVLAGGPCFAKSQTDAHWEVVPSMLRKWLAPASCIVWLGWGVVRVPGMEKERKQAEMEINTVHHNLINV